MSDIEIVNIPAKKLEIIDIESPIKTPMDSNSEKIETRPKILNNFFKKTRQSKIPLQELGENTLANPDQDKLNHSMQATQKPSKNKSRRRKRNKKSDDATNQGSNSENVKIVKEKILSPDSDPFTRNNITHNKEHISSVKNKASTSYVKLIDRHEELKDVVQKSRQAFSAYKVSTFFCFNSEFIKDFGESLTKIENVVKDMEISLGKALLKEMTKVASPQENDITKQTNCFVKLDAASTETNEKREACSIVQNSQITSEKSSPQTPPKRGRKRKIVFPSPVKEKSNGDKRERKTTRNCSVKNPIPIQTATTTMIEGSTGINGEEETKSINGTETNFDFGPTKEEEYEVRKISDYLRKQGGFFYRVSWKGYESDDDTFEPADHLNGCDEALVEFFYQRLKKRENIFTLEEFRNYILPSDSRLKELLYQAFEKLIFPISEVTRDKGMKFVVSAKAPVFKPKEDLKDEILKFMALRDPTVDRYKKMYSSIIEQISFREIYQERLKQLADLRTWERSMNLICSDPVPLYVENYVDLALPPLDFIYINEYVPGPNIIIPSDPYAGCECKECNPLQKACCSNLMNSHFAYTKNSRLRVSLGTPIYECNKMCSCSGDCINRVVQHGRKISLAIFRTNNDRGWGVKALEPIKKDQFVSEYVGEVISSDEAEQRGTKYDSKGCTYLFDLDYNKGDQNPYTVDAFRYGNVSHFINHSCDPNLVVYNVWVNCLDPDLPKLALFAARDIRKGEEITFDYNSGSTRQISILDKIDEMDNSFPVTPTKQRQGEDGNTIIPTTEIIRKTPRRISTAGKTECRCGSANCRSYFF